MSNAKSCRKAKPNKYRAGAMLRDHASKGFKILIPSSYLEGLLDGATHCSICGKELKHDLGDGYSPDSPSIDRYDNEDELRYDNIWVVCRKCNSTKSNRTMKEFYDYCKGITEKFKSEFEGA